MSSNSPQRKSSIHQEIPGRRIVLNDPSQLPSDYSSTPNGTIFSTTPGGTRIIYDRAFLMQMRNSPIARTPPKNLPNIPGVTSPQKQPRENGTIPEVGSGDKPDHDEPQFTMDV